ncbi:MAG: hypothetical protein J6S67_17735 [Methanobrevibacter sp.]|nr:hypothetical protein [Methanobrevibacter sp.]
MSWVGVSAKEIKENLIEDIKNYAGIDVQIVHRFKIESSYDPLKKETFLYVIDEYTGLNVRSEHGMLQRFHDSNQVFEYLREKYKTDLTEDQEYDVIKKKKSKGSGVEKADESKTFIKNLGLTEFISGDVVAKIDGKFWLEVTSSYTPSEKKYVEMLKEEADIINAENLLVAGRNLRELATNIAKGLMKEKTELLKPIIERLYGAEISSTGDFRWK